jgi:hypothetical protein
MSNTKIIDELIDNITASVQHDILARERRYDYGRIILHHLSRLACFDHALKEWAEANPLEAAALVEGTGKVVLGSHRRESTASQPL